MVRVAMRGRKFLGARDFRVDRGVLDADRARKETAGPRQGTEMKAITSQLSFWLATSNPTMLTS
jgi:hypothetical protein